MPSPPQSRTWNNDPFKPVSGRQWEVGVKYQPASGSWLATLAGFEIVRRKVKTPDPDHAGYAITTGEQRSRGLEAAWQGRVAAGWRLLWQATWLDAKITRDERYAPGNRLPYAPRWTSSAWLSHEFADAGHGRWRWGTGWVYVGARYADFDNQVRVPAYTRFDFGGSYTAGNWTLAASVENLFDRCYYASGVENRPAVIYPGAPRTLRFQVSHRF